MPVGVNHFAETTVQTWHRPALLQESFRLPFRKRQLIRYVLSDHVPASQYALNCVRDLI